MARLLVVGATSAVGRDVVRRLLASGRTVRVLVRTDKAALEFRSAGAETVIGDVRDAEPLRQACEGVDTVLSLFGRHFAETEQQFWDVDARGNELLADAARAASVGHFVLLSILWSDRDLPPVILRVKRRAEEAVVASGIPYTILRPSTFVEGASSLLGSVGPTVERWGLAVVPSPDTKPVSFVSIFDLAEAIVSAALGGPRERKIFEIGGPRAVTFTEGAAIVASVLGKRARIVRTPKLVLDTSRKIAKRRAFGRYEAVLFLEMLRDKGYACSPDGLRQLLAREPTSVEDAVRARYAKSPTTPWRDSIYASFTLRSR